jgi:hypothetical protein
MSTLVEATRTVFVLPFYGVAGYLTLMEALMPFKGTQA